MFLNIKKKKTYLNMFSRKKQLTSGSSEELSVQFCPSQRSGPAALSCFATPVRRRKAHGGFVRFSVLFFMFFVFFLFIFKFVSPVFDVFLPFFFGIFVLGFECIVSLCSLLSTGGTSSYEPMSRWVVFHGLHKGHTYYVTYILFFHETNSILKD